MDEKELMTIIEAILFVSGEAVSAKDLSAALEVSEDELAIVFEKMANAYEFEHRGFRMIRFDGYVQLCSRKEYAPYIEKLLFPVQRQTLTQSAMETLAIVAYRQPITRAEIENVRGVKCDSVISTLLDKGLITDMGRKDALGRPILYGTTPDFLKRFGLESLDELPEKDIFSLSITE